MNYASQVKSSQVKFLVIAACSVLSFGFFQYADAAQVGVRITQQIPQHGHSNMYDGGVLKVQGASYQDNLLSVPTLSSKYAVADSVMFDTGGFHSIVSGESRFTVPPGFSYAIINVNLLLGVQTNTFENRCIILKNGLLNVGMVAPVPTSGSISTAISFRSSFLQVISGDYFRIRCSNEDIANSLNITINADIQLYR